jgi:Fe-S cluster biogenesis protein NfuA
MNWLDRFLAAWKADAEADAPPRGDPERVAEVQAVLSELRPMFEADGGDVKLVSVEDGRVRVRLVGACNHCSAVDLTVDGALKPKLSAALPWFRGLDSE